MIKLITNIKINAEQSSMHTHLNVIKVMRHESTEKTNVDKRRALLPSEARWYRHSRSAAAGGSSA